MMNADERLMYVLNQRLGIEVAELAVGHETMWLRKDEVNLHLVTPALLEQLGETVIINSASYETEEGVYYLLICILLANEVVHEIWLVNDEIQLQFLGDLKSKNPKGL